MTEQELLQIRDLAEAGKLQFKERANEHYYIGCEMVAFSNSRGGRLVIGINDKCKALVQKVKELIDTKLCFADWLSNKNVRAELNQDLWFLLDENGYPPEYSDDVFDQVLDQVENYKEHQPAPRPYNMDTNYYPSMVAES